LSRVRIDTENTMEIGVNIRNLIVVLCCLVFAQPVFVLTSNAQTTADQMTCEQAVNYFEKNGRISIVAHKKNIIPFYIGIPRRDSAKLRCGKGDGVTYYMIKTIDNNRCVISIFCR
jgi:hypothetical protein